MLDRSLSPEFKVPEDFELRHPERFSLDNGIPVFYYPTPGIDAVKIEITCRRQREKLPLEQTLLPSFTLQMLLEGTKHKSAAEIANILDFHASEISPILTFGREGLSILSTKKHIFSVLDLLIELIHSPSFPEDMLIKRKSQRKLSIQLDREKTNARAGQLFRKALFGPSHPYGFEIDSQQVDIISQEKLRFYADQLLWQGTEVFITGNFTKENLNDVFDYLNQVPNKSILEGVVLPESNSLEQIYEQRENAVQSSLRLGYFSIPKNHPDFISLTVFNTILGGYFGSRLIKNIREDKGHTYGIYSGLAEIGNSNYWVISADVQKAHHRNVIHEIHHEIDRLIHEPLEMDELETVRNYQIGQMLGRFSSAFDLMDRFRAVYHSDLELSFYAEKLEFLKRFTADEVMKTGEKYFKNSPLIEVIVG